MADYRAVLSYRVFHYYTGPHAGTSSIYASLAGGVAYWYDNLSPERAHHLVDLLRNEKPIFIERESGLFQVASEPVGEGEETNEILRQIEQHTGQQVR